MNESTKVQNELAQLKQENQQLLEAQKTLETLIAESNSKQLHAEMVSMELEQVFFAVTDALWVLNDEGIVIRANAAMLELLDQPQDEVIGSNGYELLKNIIVSDSSSPLKPGALNEKCEYDIRIVRKDQRREDYILTAAPLTTIVGSAGIVCQFKNITERKHAEEKLSELNKALEQMALIDGLTQIANRRHFDDTIAKEWKRLARDKKPLSLLLADIDFFKKYNDHYGHQTGDDCLRQVGKSLAGAALRPADLVARYGGEEFVVLLPESDLEGALCVGQRVVESIQKLGIEHAASSVAPSVTISLGAATLIPDQNNSPQQLIELADQALYQSKEAGRNRVTAAETA